MKRRSGYRLFYVMEKNEKKYCAQALGRQGEEAVARYLACRGWHILARNWHSPRGELDIVAMDRTGAIVAVEVKTRGRDRISRTQAAATVSQWKAVKLVRCLHDFLACHPALRYYRARIDVMCVTPSGMHYFQGITDEWN